MSTLNKTIQMIDMKESYSSIQEEVEAAVLNSLRSGKYILGPNVTSFEQELAKYLDCKHVISCANGTDALIISLLALGIKPGDEVITVSFSFFATAEAIALVGAKPVFVDVNEDDFNIDVSKIEEKITDKTKAIIPVHLYGQPCEIDKVTEIAKKHNLYVVEDAAQAIGAKYKNKCVGTFGEFGTTSFYPTKNLGAFGDGGALFTNNDDLAEKAKMIRVHGSKERYIHEVIGFNSRLDDIQAAILRVKLKYLSKWNEERAAVAKRYNELLSSNSNVITPICKPDRSHIYHQYTIVVENRDEVYQKLREKGVGSIIYYPIPIHKQKSLNDNSDLPVTDLLSGKILSLPMYPELKEEDQKYICDSLTL